MFHSASAVLRYRPAWDRLGMLATSLCVGHCLTLPLLGPLAVAAGLPWLTDPNLERGLLLLTLLLACVVLLGGCRRHRHLAPLLFAASGGLFYAFKGWPGEAAEPLMVAAGGCLIVAAHAWNLHLCRRPLRAAESAR